jgi:hypothetical protein
MLENMTLANLGVSLFDGGWGTIFLILPYCDEAAKGGNRVRVANKGTDAKLYDLRGEGDCTSLLGGFRDLRSRS